MATRLDGVDDHVLLGGLTAAVQAVGQGAYTIALLMKRAGGLGTWQSFVDARSGTTHRWVYGINTADLAYWDDQSSPLRDVAGALNSTANTNLLVWSKTTGTTTAELSKKIGSAGAWTHTAASGTNINSAGTADRWDVGSWFSGTQQEFFNGWVGIIAVWNSALSQANKEACGTNWRTSDIASHAVAPLATIEGNVAGGSWTDLIGGFSTFTATGTTNDTAETLNSWNFNGLGGAAATIPSLVMAPPRAG